MKQIDVRIFHKEIELRSNGFLMDKKEVQKQFPGLRVVAIDSFNVLAGYDPENSKTGQYPVTRKICYKINGSKHKCDARCQGARGNNCECACGGKNHGINQ